MTNKRVPYPELVLLPPIVLIVARQALWGQPVFRSEFVIEDFILLLTLAGFVAPSRFRHLIGLGINCLMGTTMTLIAWTTGARKFPLVLFALLAIYSAVQALIELSKLRKHGLNGVHLLRPERRNGLTPLGSRLFFGNSRWLTRGT